ncbi:MAG TPA: endo-1,4-beta-xylanase, partial [Prolixibacteraceae bacterium]|nr:endo-1,4-beta-xylanase [Prolixibacteraceae bacterium]
MTKFNWSFFLFICLTLFSGNGLRAQDPPVPDGRRLREIIADKYQDRIMLIGGTTGAWALGTPTGKIMDREFNYVTPENDFKQSYIHPDNGSNSWNWNRPDAWKSHVVVNDQVLRMHGPVSPQCSNWAKSDNRTPQQLETNMRAYMEEQCKRYNAQPNFEYLDVINEVVVNGTWHKNKEGTDWEMPWFIIGQDNDKNKTPLFIKYAFEIANEHAPDLKLVINQHEGTINKLSWDLIFETVQYLRDKNLRVDGIGWQAHVGVGWEEIEGQQQALR